MQSQQDSEKNYVQELKEPYKSYAEVIGIRNLILLSEHFPKTSYYIPTINELLRGTRYAKIMEEYDGGNIKRLAVKYQVSERTIYRIVKDKLKAVQSRPLEGQLSLF